MVKILSVYLENSVVGGYFDEEFEEPKRNFLKNLKKGIINQLYLLM